ncbi:pilus assembly protein [Asticcacaulis sp. EMRT-3]|uniref:TadE/TadG family type IV pilus assembly protein n=1 Tax=Asticcacaulis sp. EMRT-3 TaxID=3040349 RepID=UPI0024AF6582|nr:pilus assembly protein [Asticcacaulis sp. EMRT-3]MDI7776027.1 pilus assembly protein [Asticcacaulis sp. EMRT-3]
MLRQMNRKIRQWAGLQRFAADRKGVSAIEFALVAPLLIMIYLGLAELTLGMMASRRTSHLAATIGDLAAQSETLTVANISDLWNIGNSMMQPFATGASLKMRLTSVTMSSQNKALVNWSQGSNMARLHQNDPVPAITTAQIAPGESLIMTEVEYDYDSPIGNFLPGETKFTDTFYHHPRNGAAVVCSDCPVP